MPNEYGDETVWEEIDRRITELRRPEWTWVKEEPTEPLTMCAIFDYVGDGRTRKAISDNTDRVLTAWIRSKSGYRFERYDGKIMSWGSIIGFNDEVNGAESVDDVIELLEKFRADLS